MKADLEIALAILSGLCGLLSALLAAAKCPRSAAVLGGIGLFLCNVIWMLRLV